MTSVLDTGITIGKESTYGTKASTLTRGIEGKVDTWQRQQQALMSNGFRAGTQAERSSRRTQINMGGEGNLEFDLLTNGFGLLAQGLIGSVSGPTQEGATAAYTSTFASTADEPGDFYTVQVQRPDMSGTVRVFTHLGCVPTGWTITQALDEIATIDVPFVFQDVNTDQSAESITYPGGTAFNWSQCVVSIDGVDTDVTGVSITADLGLKTDRRFIRGSELMKQPCRQTIPQFTGSIDTEFEDLTLYADFVAGAIVPITVTWTGANIEGAHNYELAITMPACQFDEGSPSEELDGVPTQSLPFKALWNESADALTMTYKSTDTAL